jgi:2EXR family
MSSIFPSPRRFTLFAELPTELKLKIWEFALLTPRVIAVKDSCIGQPHKLRAMSRQSGVTHANREAREVALKFYTVLTERFLHPIYFNPDYDIFCFIPEDEMGKFLDWDRTMDLESGDLEKSLRHIIVKRPPMWDWLDMCKYLRRFSNLDTISIVHRFDDGLLGNMLMSGKNEEAARKSIHESEESATKIISMAFKDIKGANKPLPEIRFIDPLNMMLWFDALSSGEEETEVCPGEQDN